MNIHSSLISRCKSFDPQAQLEIYQLYSKAMLNTAFRIVGIREEAEDILQESFVSAFKNINSYREEATFGAWIKRIVVNKALSHLKRSKGIQWEEVGDQQPIIDEPEEHQYPFSVEQVREAILQLPDGFRMVLSLYLLEGYDHLEIAEIMNISVSTSKTQYMRAKEKLKRMLEDQLIYNSSHEQLN